MNSPVETVERAVVFERVAGPRTAAVEHCVAEWISQFDYALLQVDLGLHETERMLFVILRLREDRFTDTSHARIVASAQQAEGRVVALSELEYQERGHFLTCFNGCTQLRLGLAPDEVVAGLGALVFERAEAPAKERRSTSRRVVNVPAVMTAGSQKHVGTVENLSEGGALLRTASPPVLQAKVQLDVQLPTGAGACRGHGGQRVASRGRPAVRRDVARCGGCQRA
jgi:PilZ domain